MAKQRPSSYRQRRQSTASNLVIVAVVLGVAFFLLVFLAACDDCTLARWLNTQTTPSLPTDTINVHEISDNNSFALNMGVNLDVTQQPEDCQCEDDTGQPDQTTPADSPPDETDTPAETDEPDDYSYEEHDSQQVSSWPSFWPAITRWITGYSALADDNIKCAVGIITCTPRRMAKGPRPREYKFADYKTRLRLVPVGGSLAPILADQVERFTRGTVHKQPVGGIPNIGVVGLLQYHHVNFMGSGGKPLGYAVFVRRPDEKSYTDKNSVQLQKFVDLHPGDNKNPDPITVSSPYPAAGTANKALAVTASDTITLYELPQGLSKQDEQTLRELRYALLLRATVNRQLSRAMAPQIMEVINGLDLPSFAGGETIFKNKSELKQRFLTELKKSLMMAYGSVYDREEIYFDCLKERAAEGLISEATGRTIGHYLNRPIAGIKNIINPEWYRTLTLECAQEALGIDAGILIGAADDALKQANK